ncbi:pilin [Candidatus Parcubacteria bacterium]|nr:pilin [Candidatus Parcubacteria bacterium]
MHNKKFTIYKLLLPLLFIVYCLLFIGTNLALAADPPKPTEYTLLAPLPLNGLDKGKVDTANTKTFIPGLIKLIIAVAGALAVIMIMYGGIQYISTAAFEGKANARKTIEDALWGLLLAISAWLILNTINPALVSLNLNPEVQQIPEGNGVPWDPGEIGGGPGGIGQIPMTPEEIAADKEVRGRLTKAGVQINAGPCLKGEGYGCTNLNGLGEAAIQGLATLKGDCKCTVMVTGGTEPGPHKTHGVGKPIVDIANDAGFRSWMASKKFLTVDGTGAVIKLSSGRQAALTFEKAGQGNSTGDHWHSIF